MPQVKQSQTAKEEAKAYSVKLTRKAPNSPHRIPKGERELQREVESRKRNWANGNPRCYKPTVAVAEKRKHHGGPCAKGEERTKSFCVKPLPTPKPIPKEQRKWVRTLTPNPETRLTLVCPR